ncbi:DUF4349 domain-containing protein [Streptomyces sp. NPDC093094]|uniref:DUF4349 domain-containing protein n=1 Tax=Streptomyces sp. NPDC093094 TaxID=3366026 RepID=UPI00382CBC06
MHRRSAGSAQTLAGLLLAAALALTGCGAGAGDSGGGGADDKAAASEARTGRAGGQGAAEGSTAAEGQAPVPDPSYIVRTAALTVQVKDVPKALEEARAVAGRAGGYVGEESTSRDAGGRERTRVVLRVPADRYDGVMEELRGAGRLLERTARAEDVTGQVVDVESRIRTQRASVARIRALMDRADRLGDVVQLEGELSTRQADLEALLARQASLKDRTSLATVTLSLTEAPVVREARGDDPGFVDALSGGWEAFLTTLRWIALVLGAVLPFAAALLLLVLLWLRVVRPRLPRGSAGTPAPASSAPASSAPAPSVATPGTLPAARPAPGPHEEAGRD